MIMIKDDACMSNANIKCRSLILSHKVFKNKWKNERENEKNNNNNNRK